MTDPVGVLYLRLLPKLLHQRDFLLNAKINLSIRRKGAQRVLSWIPR